MRFVSWWSIAAVVVVVTSVSVVHADESEALAARLGSPHPAVARSALDEVVDMGRSALPLLRETLLGDEPLACQYAAVALGRINAPGADRALVSCLRAWDDPYLLQFAGEALAARGEAALPLLEDLLGISDP
ncbi:MAG: HEAT repeat domain-containing protein, partial [Armatimonadetes bacterium]|nr:HEAT repeat domain-containing protein [Armatimonadota bacterium]